MKNLTKTKLYFWSVVLALICFACLLDGKDNTTLPNQQQEMMNEYTELAHSWARHNHATESISSVACYVSGQCDVVFHGSDTVYHLWCNRETRVCNLENSR